MSKYLITVSETYRVDTEAEVGTLLEEAKADNDYELIKYSSVHKEKKQKGEIVDDYYVVTLNKKFDDVGDPCGSMKVVYTDD